jgi:hypothetical protein
MLGDGTKSKLKRLGGYMEEPQFDKPPVRVSNSGVSYVRPADILSSTAGRREIAKAASAMTAIRTGRGSAGSRKKR